MNLETIKNILSYDKDTCIIKRIDRKNGNGSLDKDGYLIIKIKGKQYKAHRLAWLYEFGSFPNTNIDHINGIRTDNRISNLRAVSQSVNAKERFYSINTDTGEKGIYYDNSTKGLISRFTIKDGKKTLRFRTIEEAIDERIKIDIRRKIVRR